MVDGDGPTGGGPGMSTDPHAPFVVQRRHLAALLTHVDAVVLTFDAEGRVTFVSDGVSELLGYEPGELVGELAFDFVHPDDVEDLRGSLTRWVGRDGATLAQDVRVSTAWGEWRDVAFETVTGSAVEPFGAGVATMRARRESTSIEQELRRRLVNEDRLIQLARTFMADDGDFDACVQNALALMGSLESVDSIGIWRLEGGLLYQRHQWTAPTIPVTMGDFRPFAPDEVEFTRRLARLEEVVLRGRDIEGGGRTDTDEMARRGARCFVAVPMVTDGRFSGYVSFASYRDEDIFAPTHRSTLRAAAGILAEAFARHDAQHRLRFQARHDSLTGLANRWAFGAAVEHASARAAAGVSPGLAVLLFDLDRFHIINDSLGHAAGDHLLMAVADRLTDGVDESELLARLGGDELVVLLPEIDDPADAVARAEGLLARLAEPFLVGSSRLAVTASVGVAVARGGGDRSRLLREADVAMYRAKRNGGRQVQLFDATLHRQVSERLEREHDLHGVVERGELLLHYQPEFDLRTDEVVAVEALLRWQHPRDGLLDAGAFVGLAEDSGLIVDIGLWIIEQAFTQLLAWDRAATSVVMRVNLSARQLAQPSLVAWTADRAARLGVDPRQVCFELTETSVMVDPLNAHAVLDGLRSHGFTIAIDDFGTGYSSLAYLRDFPVDLLKIDRSFVARLGDSKADAALVRAMVSMAEALGVPVTAEGIETDRQRKALLRLGCPYGQGFGLARPGPPDEIAERLFAVTPRL